MHPLVELTVARIKETIREPEVLFWVFVFPILLAIALGIALPGKTLWDKLRIGIEKGTGAEQILKLLSARKDMEPVVLDAKEADEQLRKGKVDLIVSIDRSAGAQPEGEAPRNLVFTYDQTRSASEIARLASQDAIEPGPGPQGRDFHPRQENYHARVALH